MPHEFMNNTFTAFPALKKFPLLISFFEDISVALIESAQGQGGGTAVRD